MRAARLFVLLIAISLLGPSLIRPEGILPFALRFIEPLLADPRPSLPADPPKSAAAPSQLAAPSPVAEHRLPAFVASPQSLTFSSDGSKPGQLPTSDLPTTLAATAVAGSDRATSNSTVAAVAVSAASLGASATVNYAAETAGPEPVEPAKPIATAIKIEPDPTAGAATPSPAQTKGAPGPEIIGAKNLFGTAKTPAPLAARAIGSYARGCLSGAVALPIDGPAWQAMRLSRNRNWGHPKLIALVEQLAADAQKLDRWQGLLVGDIAQPRGGPMISGHASHQIGLDADVWLTPMPDHRLSAKEREDIQATSMLDSTDIAVDPKVFTEKQVALIKRAASYPEVDRIFIHPAIKKALCKTAGADHKWLGKVRPYYGHYYHMHIRIKCPTGFGGCTPQEPPSGDDGCGKEVDQWLARVAPPKTPAPPSPPGLKPKPSEPPVMLSELPQECQAVLKAGPDPVSIPQEALMTPATARKVLAKAAAAASATAAKAATGSAGSTAVAPVAGTLVHNTAIAADKK